MVWFLIAVGTEPVEVHGLALGILVHSGHSLRGDLAGEAAVSPHVCSTRRPLTLLHKDGFRTHSGKENE